jgi:uncharacterized membrane protein YdfJ with MMPL/SSD domain
MIGLAVGIDYALFIVSRYRTELVKYIGGNDLEPRELAAKLKEIDFRQRAHLAGLAVGKAGSAVVFAGLTVLIALAALSIINIPFLTAMALSAAATVAIAVLVAITLLPAILGAVGTKAFGARIGGVKAPDPEDEKPTMGLTWVRHPRGPRAGAARGLGHRGDGHPVDRRRAERPDHRAERGRRRGTGAHHPRVRRHRRTRRGRVGEHPRRSR